MKTIKHKTNGITINGDGINSSQNTVIYNITIPISDIEYAVSVFPFINGATQLSNSKFTYGQEMHIGNLPEIMQTSFVETEDLGLSGDEVMDNFSTSILFLTNAFDLDLNDWELVNE